MLEISSVGFVSGGGDDGMLFISFEDGSSVMYQDVPSGVYQALEDAPTYESYFYANIHGRYNTLG